MYTEDIVSSCNNIYLMLALLYVSGIQLTPYLIPFPINCYISMSKINSSTTTVTLNIASKFKT